MAEEKLFIEASEEDVPSIIALRQRIWDTTYRGIYPDSMIDNFDWDWHREMELLRVHHPAYSVYLIRKDRQDIGYLTINEADVITLQSLYISAEYQRQGIGRQAFDFVKAYCRAHHAASFVCHCVPENLNARSFYERMGGKVIGQDLANEERWQNSVTYQFTPDTIKLLKKKVEGSPMNNITKTAMITICGRPNVGKSSLTNALVGEKIAIVSDKPQTTRNRIYGVVNREDTQFVLLDTPGLHKPRSRLGTTW